LGESSGEMVALGEWQRGNVGDVCTIIDFRWPRVEGRRVDNDSSFCRRKEKTRFSSRPSLGL